MGDKRKRQEAKRKAKLARRRSQRRAAPAPNAAEGDSLLPQIATTQREIVGKIIQENRTGSGVLEATANTLAFGDMLSRRHLTVLPGERTIACGEGCHWCCYLKVEASAAEVLLIAEALRSSLEPQAMQELSAKVAEAAKDPRIFSVDDKPRARIACPLLRDGMCSVYSTRPLACRGWNSYDPESCRRSLDEDEEGETMVSLTHMFHALAAGLSMGVHDAGLAAEMVELTAGLDVALNEPDALNRWIGGEAIFARARAVPLSGGVRP